MGADIWMFIEHKNPATNKWNLVKMNITGTFTPLVRIDGNRSSGH